MAKGTFSTSNHYYFPTSVTTTPITLSAWVYRTGTTGDEIVVAICRPSGSIFNRFYGWQLKASNTDEWEAATQSYITIYSALVAQGATDKWMFLCATFDSNDTDRAIYKFEDGVMSSDTDSTLLAPVVDPARVVIGINYNANGQVGFPFSHGYIARASGWSTVLSEGEIRSLAYGSSPDQIQTDKLIFYVPLIRYNSNKKSSTLPTEVGIVPTQSTEPPVQVTVPFSPDNSQSSGEGNGNGNGNGAVRRQKMPLYGLKLNL